MARIRTIGFSKGVTKAVERSRRVAGRPSVETIPNAIVAGLTPKRIGNFDGYCGGVYEPSGNVCPLSLVERSWTKVTAARDQPPQTVPIRVPGRALYAGLLFDAFGHFLLESTARLWWALESGFDGPILFNDPERAFTRPWVQEFFALMGLLDRVRVIEYTTQFDEVVVPGPSFVIQKQFHDVFHLPFRRIAETLGVGPGSSASDRIYLSRGNLTRRRCIGEPAIEAHFAARGYRIVHLEEFGLADQIRLVGGAHRVAGIVGSALHTLLFSDVSERSVIYVSRDDSINLNFPMIDELLDIDAIYIQGSAVKIVNHDESDLVLDTDTALTHLRFAERKPGLAARVGTHLRRLTGTPR
jgi:hypothetical protein